MNLFLVYILVLFWMILIFIFSNWLLQVHQKVINFAHYFLLNQLTQLSFSKTIFQFCQISLLHYTDTNFTWSYIFLSLFSYVWFLSRVWVSWQKWDYEQYCLTMVLMETLYNGNNNCWLLLSVFYMLVTLPKDLSVLFPLIFIIILE